jgi:hypothetical protein
MRRYYTNRPRPGPIIVIEGAAVLNAAKIAAIALHTVPGLTREEARRRAVLILCSALGHSLFGSADFLVFLPTKPADSPPSLCHKWRKLMNSGTGRREIPCHREFPSVAAPNTDRQAASVGLGAGWY